jgi:hypothetical protein
MSRWEFHIKLAEKRHFRCDDHKYRAAATGKYIGPNEPTYNFLSVHASPVKTVQVQVTYIHSQNGDH